MKLILRKLSDKQLVFKGGSSLLFGYGLDRYSEDLDFDATYEISVKSLINTLKDVLRDYSIKKDTNTTKRLIVTANNGASVKIEISFRELNKTKDTKCIPFINKMRIYTIDELLKLKINALINRVVARDLYDIAFILGNYYEEIKKSDKELLRICYDLIGKDVVNVIIDYEDCFAEDKILDIEDLFLAAQRLERFKKTYEVEKETPILSKKENPHVEEKSKESKAGGDDMPGG